MWHTLPCRSPRPPHHWQYLMDWTTLVFSSWHHPITVGSWILDRIGNLSNNTVNRAETGRRRDGMLIII